MKQRALRFQVCAKVFAAAAHCARPLQLECMSTTRGPHAYLFLTALRFSANVWPSPSKRQSSGLQALIRRRNE
jgi:hypothetical protein